MLVRKKERKGKRRNAERSGEVDTWRERFPDKRKGGEDETVAANGGRDGEMV